jgi:uncharacterized membrane protein
LAHGTIWSIRVLVPFYTGLVFALPLLLFVFLMEKYRHLAREDIAYRAARIPMTPNDRKAFRKEFLGGLIACILIYCFATIFRDIRDNFSAEMWKEMGFFNKPELFAKTETPITLIVLVLIGSMVFLLKTISSIKNSALGLF